MKCFSVSRKLTCGFALVALPLAAVAQDAPAVAGFPFSENFQSQAFYNASSSTARWSRAGVTLGRSRGVHGLPTVRNVRVGNPTRVEDLAIDDLDGDGYLDVAVAGKRMLAAYLNRRSSSGAVSFVYVSVSAESHEDLALGDFDRDGDVDIAANRKGGVFLYRNVSSGVGTVVFAARESIYTPPANVDDGKATDIAAADFNGDGWPDLVLATEGDPMILGNTGAGGFASPRTISVSVIDNIVVEVGDLNGDGYPDVVLAGESSAYVLNEGGDGWRFRRQASLAGAPSDVTAAALGDVDGDGDLDLVLGAYKRPNRLYWNNGGSFDGGRDIGAGVSRKTSSVALGDVDGDGDLDMVEGIDKKAHALHFYANDGAGSFAAAADVTTLQTKVAALADLDNDGDLDVIAGRSELRAIMNLAGDVQYAPSTQTYDAARAWVASGGVNAAPAFPALAHLAATEVRPLHTEVAYYLSADGGRHWRRARPGDNVRLDVAGGELRWGARLSSRSPSTSPRIVRVGIEDGVRVSVGGENYASGSRYLATASVMSTTPTSAPLRLWNRGHRPLRVVGVGIGAANEGFRLPPGMPSPSSPRIVSATGAYQTALEFGASFRQRYETTLTLSMQDADGRALPDYRLSLVGNGTAAVIGVRVLPNVNAPYNGSRKFYVAVRNSGEEPLRVSNATISGGGFSLVGDWKPFTVGVGGNQEEKIRLAFMPSDIGAASATLTFASNAVNAEDNVVALRGTGRGPRIEVEFGGDFGQVYVGDEITTQVVIRNVGNELLSVGLIFSSLGMFTDLPAMPLTLSAAQSIALTMKFRPTRAGRLAGILFISSNSDRNPYSSYDKPLSAMVVTPQVHLSPSSLVMEEGASATLVVRRDGALSVPTTVTYGIRGVGSSATLSDLSDIGGARLAAVGSVTIAAGATTAAIVIAASDDADAEDDESFVVSLHDASGGAMVAQPARTTVTVPANDKPGIVIDSPDVSEISAVLGTSRTFPASVTNEGNAPLTITSATVGLPFALAAPWQPITLPVAAPLEFAVVFTPTRPGIATATLTFGSNAHNAAANVRVLRGRGTVPRISITVGDPSAGAVRVGDTITRTVTIFNVGDASLTVTGVSALLDGQTVAASAVPFTVTTSQLGHSLALSFEARTPGHITGQLTVFSNAYRNQVHRSTLTANVFMPVWLSPSSLVVPEGASATLAVNRAAALSAPTTVSYTISATGAGATARDLAGVAGPLPVTRSVTIAAGATTASIVIGALDDTESEATRSYVVTLRQTASVVPEPPSQAVMTIPENDRGTLVKINVLLQGAYINTTPSMMRTPYVRYLPKRQPYNVYPWHHAATTTVPHVAGNHGLSAASADVVDWVLVELRTVAKGMGPPAANSMFLLKRARQAALLLYDGRVAGVDESAATAAAAVRTGGVHFDINIDDSAEDLYVLVDHRNHLPVMSAGAVSRDDCGAADYCADFTRNQAHRYCSQIAAAGGGPFLMVAGDVNRTGGIGLGDRNFILIHNGTDITAASYANPDTRGNYVVDADLNFSGSVHLSARNLILSNNGRGSSFCHP